mmetsp:Transcript_20388/g.70537  ORF Transcript_20388/g.70537 Transcript_20388/m.70537 type:complete len:236 (+) Transcript_20388:461-1168(+)
MRRRGRAVGARRAGAARLARRDAVARGHLDAPRHDAPPQERPVRPAQGVLHDAHGPGGAAPVLRARGERRRGRRRAGPGALRGAAAAPDLAPARGLVRRGAQGARRRRAEPRRERRVRRGPGPGGDHRAAGPGQARDVRPQALRRRGHLGLAHPRDQGRRRHRAATRAAQARHGRALGRLHRARARGRGPRARGARRGDHARRPQQAQGRRRAPGAQGRRGRAPGAAAGAVGRVR